jgi:uncharacterized membrane protein
MKMQCVLGLSLWLAGSVWAQSAGEGVSVLVPQDARTQRRAELRQSLQPPPAPGMAAPATPRQLSPQERQALREQLRQQRTPAAAARPSP